MFITFEGIEGSGKSTAMRAVAETLQQRGHGVLLTREPGGSELGGVLRRILLDVATTDLAPEAELFLYLADRAQHVRQVIRPALAEDIVVLCDRYADSTVVYQGYGRSLDRTLLHQCNHMAVGGLWPDCTLLLDLEPHVGLTRALARNVAQAQAAREGRFEAESLDFHRRIREGYLTLAALHRERFRIIDASQPLERVVADCLTVVESLLSPQ
ncbi:dTMP kinase [Megalodesulfovibrio gigas]|uniref:Thymidylate kinase n=1 Tax=Megalodesulfovibrio gigas (strain ATCC 19364 / DSM 1382 / NCIMB 9332 / VKM B-1759) TaxID=1121448 RepID=T2GCP0_MEGG1|nr:dTMP kinase [Megalodesulfovibrio gigas]AGW13949.1 putative thymidylate kinase [Megalodesulfovibrio gigas DSM 1382 = ATCC 19364]